MNIFLTIFFIVLNEQNSNFRNFWRIFITIIACIFFIMFWKNKIKFCKITNCLIGCSIKSRNIIESKKNHNSRMMSWSQRTCKQNWISINCKHSIESSQSLKLIRRPLIFIYKNRKKRKKSFYIKLFVIITGTKKKQIFCITFIKIAAFFLPNGRTSHSAFGIFIEHDENSIFVIKKNKWNHYFIRIDLIIWNDIIMQHKNYFEIMNKLFKNLHFNSDESMKSCLLFDEVSVVFGGNFVQILFIIEHDERFDVVNACFQKFYIWPQLIILKFTKNMRVIKFLWH